MGPTPDPLGVLQCATARDTLARQALTELAADTADPRLVSIAGALSDLRPMLRTLHEVTTWAQASHSETTQPRVLAPVEGNTQFYSFQIESSVGAEAVLEILTQNLLGHPAHA